MIRKPNNWNEVQEFTDRPKLPLDAYVCKVKKAVVQHNDYGEQLCILFDIAEGEYRGFYDNDYNENTSKDKKWKGVLRQFIPKDDGSEKDEWTKRSFKSMTSAFEKSNPGYFFDWNEASLAGKMIGVLFRNEEWDYNGKTGWAVRPYRAIAVPTVVSGEFTLPKDKPLKNKTSDFADPGYSSGYSQPVSDFSQPVSDFSVIEADDAELPF